MKKNNNKYKSDEYKSFTREWGPKPCIFGIILINNAINVKFIELIRLTCT